MENAAVISDEPDARVRHSARSRQPHAWMGYLLLGKDFDSTLPPLGRGVCYVARRHLVPVSSQLKPCVLLLSRLGWPLLIVVLYRSRSCLREEIKNCLAVTSTFKYTHDSNSKKLLNVEKYIP